MIKVNLGFLYVFAFGMLTCALAMAYVTIFLPDSLQIRNERLKRKEQNGEELEEHEKEILHHHHLGVTHSTWAKVKHFLDWENLKSGFAAIFRKRPHGQRRYLLLLIFCFEMEMFINVGDWGNAYLYFRRVLEFDLQDYTKYTVVVGVIGIVSQFVFVPFFSSKLKLRDSVISVIDLTGEILLLFSLAFK